MLLVIGTAASFFGARAVARSDNQKSRQVLATNAADIASTLELTIQHEQDLAVAAGAFVVGNPDATQAQFVGWSNSVHAFANYPELLAIAEVTLVPSSQLAAYGDQEVAHPTGSLSANGTFQVVPPGHRPYYCFETVAQRKGAQQSVPAGTDYCQSPLGPALLETRDSGRSVYVPFGTGANAVLAVGTAIYRGGTIPPTVQARRDALIGWTGAQIVPSVVLRSALDGHPDTGLAFRFGKGAGGVTLRAGSVPAGAESTIIGLHNGWHVEVFGTVTGDAVLSNRSALILLLAGIALSVLLGALIFVLGTSRERALALVNERTDELRHRAFHDLLTGLPNRALILDRAEQMLARSRREGTQVAALFLDLDDFKDINDTFGHSAGDQLLNAVGARLAAALRDGDTVGRLGGDEFVVLVGGPSLQTGAAAVAERILELFDAPFEIAGADVAYPVRVSIGVAQGDRGSADELLGDADVALYRAKQAGKQRALVFTSEMHEAFEDHRSLEMDLRRALDANQFFLLYQPIFDLSTGEIAGVEALLRWQHPVRGVVQPDGFIPVLESTGLIVPIGQWVLETAIRQGAEWLDHGHRLAISVNISGRQLERERIVDDVRDALVASGFDPGMLILELTETSLMQEVDTIVTRLDLLKGLGVRIAIDDFGMGYSSISYLQQFPVDILKIDQSFVSRIAETRESAALVHTLVRLGQVLGLQTTAEGIETEEQRAHLRAEDVDYGQGFLLARPLEVQSVDRLLKSSVASSSV
jgi:diguanylate cyclase (GGDEF)-like protein